MPKPKRTTTEATLEHGPEVTPELPARRAYGALRLTFTPAWVESLKPGVAPVEWRDVRQRGLVLRVEVSGRKAWVCRYRFTGRDRRYPLGTWPETTLAAARTRAARMLTLVEAGTDPMLERERLRIGQSLGAALDAWLSDEKQGPAAKWKGGLTGGSARSFMPHANALKRDPLAKHPLAKLTPEDCARFVGEPEAPATRNRRLTMLRGLLKWARRHGLIATDPTAEIGKERETERARVLSDDELRALITGFGGTRYGRAVRLLALTGLRRDEVLGARWDWLDVEAAVMTIPREADKSGAQRGETRRVALSSHVVRLLAEQRAALFAEGTRAAFVFATSSGARAHGDALKPTLYKLRGRRQNGTMPRRETPATLTPDASGTLATLHDLRRTVAHALLNRLGAAPWVVDHVVLGHVRPKLMRTYMPVLPLDEARAALERWGDLLDTILSGTARAAAR